MAEPEAAVNLDADRAIMAFLRESRRARDLPRVGAFVLLLSSATRLRFLNYAMPDDGADPDDAQVSALVLPSVAPAIEARLTAHGWSVDDRLPLMTCTATSARDVRVPDGVVVEAPSDDAALLEMARLQHDVFDDPEPADDRTVTRLQGVLSRGGHALIARDTDSRHLVGAAQSGPAAGGATEVVGVAVAPSHRRRGLAAAMVSALARHGFDSGLATVFLEAAPGADGAYRNAGFLRTSTSVHMSLASDTDA
jgi:predicted GNAT family acetyltransferase